jgi:alpha-amylase
MTLSLLFGVHAHQPVGNFPQVIDEAHLRCYRMFLQTLEQYPEFRFSAHFSGWLLEVLLERYPQDMARLQTMTQRGQIEWFGSGDCEPVLAAIPHRDRLSQIEALSTRLERLFGKRPKGAWLTERVWESSVVTALADSGISYVAVDDYHFLCAGQSQQKLDSFWTTEDDERALDLFPISEQARYRLPFSPASDAVAWLEDLAQAGQSAAIYFDDIEKFGIWPETYAWVYEKGWLAQFIEGVLGSTLIRTSTYADYHAARQTRGVIYLPTTSYIEMNAWTLPAGPAHVYHDLVDQEKKSGHFEARKPFLRGGIWRNFFSRYAESNWMHKRMLQASARLAALPQTLQSPDLLQLLHRAQANDAYWHGLFGGLYLPHLRRAIWNNLLALEARIVAVDPPPALMRADADLDGCTEVFMRDAAALAVVREDGDACVIEWSSYVCAHNFGDSLRLTEEAYHAGIGQSDTTTATADGIASAHDRVAYVHPVTAQDVVPDARPRGIFVDTWIAQDGSRTPLDSYVRDPDTGQFVAGGSGWRVEKRFDVVAGALVASYRCVGNGGYLETQLNIAMPSCDGYSGRYILADGSIPCGFGQQLAIEGAAGIWLDDGVLGGTLQLTCQQAKIRARPHFTVSGSEAGFEKIMQSAELVLTWPCAGVDHEFTASAAREIQVRLEYVAHTA